MKSFNVVLSILILLLALVLAASSYFLYEKREVMLDGWNKLADAINKTAAVLDKDSGTENAKALTTDTLAHANYAQLDEELPKIVAATEAVVKQRNSAAAALREIATEQEMKNVPSLKSYTELASFEASKKATVANAKEFRKNRDNVIGAIVKTAGMVKVSLSTDELKRGNVSVFGALDSKIREILDIMGACQDNIRAIAGVTGAASPDFDPAKYKSSLEAVKVSVSDLKGKYDAALRDIAARDNQITDLNAVVKDRDGKIVTLNKTLSDKDVFIGQLKKMLEIGENTPDPWEPGSMSVRKALRGKIVEVNTKFGFYVIDVGRNTRVRQPIGNKINEVDPRLEKGMNMRVARGVDGEKIEYVRRVKLTNVLDDCSIIESVEGDKDVKVGDTVYLVLDEEPAAAAAAN